MNHRARSNRPCRRRHRAGCAGYTLVEGMIASVLLAASTVGVTGAMSASFAHDTHAANRRAAVLAGRQLLDEVAALPMTSAASSDPSMAQFTSYGDSASTAASASVLASRVAPVTSTTGTTSSTTTSGGTTSSGGLLGGLVTSVGGVVNGLLGGGGGSGSGSTSGGTGTGTSSGTTSGGSTTTTVVQPGETRVNRQLTITRHSTLNGPADPAGDFALLRLNITNDDGTTTTLTRLVSSAEAQANRTQ